MKILFLKENENYNKKDFDLVVKQNNNGFIILESPEWIGEFEYTIEEVFDIIKKHIN